MRPERGRMPHRLSSSFLKAIISELETTMMRLKTWLLFTVCVVTVFGIGLWIGGRKKEVPRAALTDAVVIPQIDTIEEPQQAVTTEALPREPAEKPAFVTEVIILDEPTEDEEEEVIVAPSEGLVTIHGAVTSMDPCLQTITVDGATVDVSSHPGFPMYRTYQIGDVVEVTYREKKSGNVLYSITTLQER